MKANAQGSYEANVQGSLAKAVGSFVVIHHVTFAPRIAEQFLNTGKAGLLSVVEAFLINYAFSDQIALL